MSARVHRPQFWQALSRAAAIGRLPSLSKLESAASTSAAQVARSSGERPAELSHRAIGVSARPGVDRYSARTSKKRPCDTATSSVSTFGTRKLSRQAAYNPASCRCSLSPNASTASMWASTGPLSRICFSILRISFDIWSRSAWSIRRVTTETHQPIMAWVNSVFSHASSDIAGAYHARVSAIHTAKVAAVAANDRRVQSVPVLVRRAVHAAKVRRSAARVSRNPRFQIPEVVA